MAAYNEQKIRKLISLRYPLFIKYLIDFPPQKDTSIKTACTDGEKVLINPGFMAAHSENEQLFILAHEYAHNFMLHHIRGKGKDHELWNEATDFAVNDFLVYGGLQRPKLALFDIKYHNKTAEEIYTLLEKKQGKDKGQGQEPQKGKWSPDKHGELKQAKGNGKPQEQIEQEAKQRQREAITIGQMSGTMPEKWKRTINELIEPDLDWRQLLAELLQKVSAREDFTYSKPSRRHSDSEFIHPGMDGEETPTIAIFGDTSGSISNKMLAQHTGAILELVEQVEPETTLVLWIDTRVQSFQEITPYEKPRLSPMGGGGTDFRPGFAWINKNRPEVEAIIYLTDGYCSRFPVYPPACPVIWILWEKNRNFNPPFGSVIHM